MPNPRVLLAQRAFDLRSSAANAALGRMTAAQMSVETAVIAHAPLPRIRALQWIVSGYEQQMREAEVAEAKAFEALDRQLDIECREAAGV